MATSLSENFTLETLGTRPVGWTPTGSDATDTNAWKIENRGGGQPNDLRLGDNTDTGRRNAFLAPTGVGGKLGLVRATFKHYQLRAGFGESSAGLGVGGVDRGGTNHPAGIFILGNVTVDTSTLSLTMRVVDAAGNVGSPGSSFVASYPGMVANTAFTLELERDSLTTLRFRAYPTGNTPPAWATYTMSVAEQAFTGLASLYYTHNNGNTIANARYETFQFVAGDNPTTPSVSAVLTGLSASATGSSFVSPLSATHAATEARLVAAAVVISTQTGTGTGPFTFSGLASSTTFTIQMRYQDNIGNWSEWGTSNSFTTPTPPGTPVVTVLEASTVSAIVLASAFVGSETHTDSQFRVVLNDDTIIFDSGTGLGPITSHIVTGLQPGFSYRAQVRYRDDLLVWGQWGEASFQTQPGGTLITDYTSLRRAIARWLNRRDLEEEIPVFIQLGEKRLQRDLRFKLLLHDTVSLTGETVALPSAWKSVEAWVHDGPIYFGPIETVGYDQLSNAKARLGATGVPRYVAFVDRTAYFAPVPNGTFVTKRAYWSRVTPLSDSSTTNAFLTEFPDIYLYAALVESAPYLKDDARIGLWRSELEGRLEELRSSTWDQQFSGRTRLLSRAIGG